MDEKEKYLNPYLAGIFLGLLLTLTIYITGRGLGASGAVKSITITTIRSISNEHAQKNKFYNDYLKGYEKSSPLKNFLVFEVLGVIIGAFMSGLYSNRLNFVLEKGENCSIKKRYIFAFLGGILWGIGSQFGRGCTSGAALSGLAVMSTGGILTMLSIFGGAYLFAYFFRKLWI